jgi:hypothetical protein
LLGRSHVISVDFNPKIDQFLYQRNVQTEYFILILSGKIEIESGEDHFLTEKGPWSSLGIRTLNNKVFIPDYTCKVLNGVKYLSISKNDYKNVVLLDYELDKSIYIPEKLNWILDEKKEQVISLISSPHEIEKPSPLRKYSKIEEIHDVDQPKDIELSDVLIDKSQNETKE